ncbi:hypothetical protein [Stenotrophomonas nematodicola]|uniref:Uncharacterized protein n=1 Tax=Stenotrophomonas nematodicola TaxID=2656746 RepID=A0ABW7D0U1_9GAMM
MANTASDQPKRVQFFLFGLVGDLAVGAKSFDNLRYATVTRNNRHDAPVVN